MIKMWKRLTCMLLSVLMIMSLLPMGVGAVEEKDTNSSVMTSVSVKSDNVGYYSPTNDESITLNGTSYTSGVTTNADGTITYTNIEQVSFKLPDTYSAGETIYVHVTGTVGNDKIRMFLINSYGGTTSTNYYATATDGSFEYWGEMTVSSDGTASEINFKGDSYGVVITSLTVTSIEIFEGTAAEYTCAINGHTYVNGVCTVCGDEEDHCTDILLQSGLSSTYGDVTVNSDGSFTANSGIQWIAIKLDRAYSVGETVTIHISGTSEESAVRFYLSESDQSNRITPDKTLSVTNGVFDGEIEFTVMDSSTDSTYSGTQAIYLNIKSTTYQAFSSLTITHLGVVQYDVTVSEPTNGSVAVDKTRAGEGETVTLTVTPDKYYEFGSLTVTDASGNTVDVSDDNTFIMPASNVTVNATFTYVGDSCGTTIEMSSSSVRSTYSSSVTVVEGTSINSSAEQFELALPNTVSSGETVTVHIVGTSDADFRIWLADGYDQLSESVKASNIGYSGSGEFDLTFDLAFSDLSGKDITSASYILFKGSAYGTNLDNLTVTHVGVTYPEATVPEFYGRTLTLDGKIGVTYYFDMTGVTNPSSYVLKATIGTGGTEQTITAGETKTINGVEYYRYTVYVGVADINTEITAVLTDGTSSVDVSGYSVANYCSAVESGSLPESELCTALLTYGNYAGIYNNQTDVGLDSYTLSDVSIDIKDTEFGTDVTRTDGYEKTLVLDDEISIRLYMTTEQAVYVNGVAYAPESNTDSNSETYAYRVDIPVPAKDMNEMYEICDENGVVLTKYSVYSYILNKQNDSDEKLANLVKAIYNYSLKAESYDGWI